MALSYLWILLLCQQTWPEVAGRDTDVHMMDGILGESITFPLNIQESQQLRSIVWTAKTSVAFIEPGDSGKAPVVRVTHNDYDNRIEVIAQNYNLIISDLKMEDAGDYKADIRTEKATTTQHYHLQVYRRLGKPKITQSLMTSMNNTCNVTLICSVEQGQENVTYSWSPLGEKGNVLQVFQTPADKELTYTCTAWNPVSNNSDSISVQQLCAGITQGSQIRHTGLLSVLAVLILAVLILSSVFLLRLCKRRQGSHLKAFTKSSDDASKKTIYACITPSGDTQPAEVRIYDEIRQSKVGEILTQKSKSPRTSGCEVVV
ncbi:SLAM family member 5 isoform X2 [Perognathus longimembris pacificus]|uniref:SLAM family member 5 isoform X2 n=1 Tax=Perognathus longimembris pacificus TaxID=214514 RepID=UPI00201A0189|nr:SLAM family member 5 isoform X2 [Perognathus longimembris pacificus]